MNLCYRLIVFFSFLWLLSAAAPLQAKAEDKGKNPQEGHPWNPGSWLADTYRDYISPVDGSRCPSVPSCSMYSLLVFQKHGFFGGWMMTVDRLIHEGKEETLVSPLIYEEGKWKIFDPPENNDFWWFQKKAGEKTHNE